MKIRARLLPVVSMAVLALAGCTSTPHEPPPTATAAGPGATTPAAAKATCEAKVDVPADAMLQVRDVWPKTTSIFFGFDAMEFDPMACAAATQGGTTPQRDCAVAFPWMKVDQGAVRATLGAHGVRLLVAGAIRGHKRVAVGQTAYPQELRETLMVLKDDAAAATMFLTDSAAKCGEPFAVGKHPNTYRLSIRSTDIEGNITAIFTVAGNKLIWLEFDDGRWVEADYLTVLDKAIATAARYR